MHQHRYESVDSFKKIVPDLHKEGINVIRRESNRWEFDIVDRGFRDVVKTRYELLGTAVVEKAAMGTDREHQLFDGYTMLHARLDPVVAQTLKDAHPGDFADNFSALNKRVLLVNLASVDDLRETPDTPIIIVHKTIHTPTDRQHLLAGVRLFMEGYCWVQNNVEYLSAATAPTAGPS